VLSAHLHPEFGWLCPSRGLRLTLRVLLALLAVGLIAAGSSVVALIADHNPNSDALVAIASPEVGPAALEAAAAPPPKLESKPSPATKPDSRKSDLGKADAGKTDGSKRDAGKAAEPKANVVEPQISPTEAKSCDENTWAYLDGTCIGGQVRKVRVVRMPIARAAAPAGTAEAGTRAARVKADTKSDSKSGDASAPPGAAPSAPPAAAKKPQRTAQSRNRTRGQDASRDPFAARGMFAGFFGFYR
jgi:hypothetical protein